MCLKPLSLPLQESNEKWQMKKKLRKRTTLVQSFPLCSMMNPLLSLNLVVSSLFMLKLRLFLFLLSLLLSPLLFMAKSPFLSSVLSLLLSPLCYYVVSAFVSVVISLVISFVSAFIVLTDWPTKRSRDWPTDIV